MHHNLISTTIKALGYNMLGIQFPDASFTPSFKRIKPQIISEISWACVPSYLLTFLCLLSFRPSHQTPTAQQHNAHSLSGSDDIVGVVPPVTLPVAQEQIIPQHCYIKCYRWTRKFYDGHNSAYSVKPFPGKQCLDIEIQDQGMLTIFPQCNCWPAFPKRPSQDLTILLTEYTWEVQYKALGIIYNTPY